MKTDPYKPPGSKVEDRLNISATDHLAGTWVVFLASAFLISLSVYFLFQMVAMSPRTIAAFFGNLSLAMATVSIMLHLYYGSSRAKWVASCVLFACGLFGIFLLVRYLGRSLPGLLSL